MEFLDEAVGANVGAIHGVRGSSTDAAVIFVPPLQDEGGSSSDVDMDTDVAMAVQAVDLESVHLVLSFQSNPW